MRTKAKRTQKTKTMEMEYNYESNRVGIYTQTSIDAAAIGAGFAPCGEKSPVAINPYVSQTNEYGYGASVGNAPNIDRLSGNNFGSFDSAPPFNQRTGDNFGNIGRGQSFDQSGGYDPGNMGNVPYFAQNSSTHFGNFGNVPQFYQPSGNNFESMQSVPQFGQNISNNFGSTPIAPLFHRRTSNTQENIGNAPFFGGSCGDNIGNWRNTTYSNQTSSNILESRQQLLNFDQRSSDSFENKRNASNIGLPSFGNFESSHKTSYTDTRSCDSFESRGNASHLDQRSCDSFVSKGNASLNFDQRSSDSFVNSDNPFKKNIDFTQFQIGVNNRKHKSKKQKKREKRLLDPREWREKRERSRAIAAEKNIPSSVKQFPLCEEFFGEERWKRAFRTLKRIGYNTWEINAMYGNLDLMLREGKLEKVDRPALPSDDEEDIPKWRKPSPPRKKKRKKNKSEKEASRNPELKTNEQPKTGNENEDNTILRESRRRKLIKSEEVYEEPDLSGVVEEEVKDDLRLNIGDASQPDFRIPSAYRNDVIIRINQLMVPEDKSLKRRDQNRAVLNFIYTNGKLLVVCKNKYTAEFIESILTELNALWEGAQLVLCPRYGIRTKIQICIKDCDFSTEDTLTIISRQNAIDTKEWAVTKRHNDKSTAYLDVVIDANAYCRFFVDQEDMFFLFTRALLKILN